MPDLNNTALTSFNGWTLRIRESTDPSPRLLLLIHGLTGDENSMWVFARDMPSQYWMIAPRAPHAAQMEQGGYSWRPPQSKRSTTPALAGGARVVPGARDGGPVGEDLDQLSLDQLRSAAEALIRLVDEYSASAGLDAGVFDVMGFSQGAGMSSLLAFLYPRRIRKVGILAGFVPSGLAALVSQRPLEGKSFLVAHGTKDETVAIERARASIETLEQAGAQVTYCEDEVGHKVSITCLRALKKFLSD